MRREDLQRAPILLIFVLVLAGLLASSLAHAQGRNRVALVVATGDGTAVTRCVSFEEEEISGYEVLSRSGIGVDVDLQAGSAAVCGLGGTGCPADDCFCQCQGGDACVYWSYWHLKDDGWQYAVGGASAYNVRNGDIEGWSWGPGSVTEAVPPPVFTFEEICPVDLGSDLPTPIGDAIGVPTVATAISQTTPGPAPIEVTALATDREAIPAETTTNGSSDSVVAYLAFASIVLALFTLLLLARRRSRGTS